MSSIRTPVTLAWLSLVCLGSSGAAQGRVLPPVRSFELPEAAPRVHGFVGRMLSVQQGESAFGDESEAEVGLGEDFPLLALRRGPRPITLGFGAQLYGRFSLGDSKSALISNDWIVELSATADLTPWVLTLRVYHESSHLGDEYEDRFDATRLDWSREVAGVWASYSRGPWRLTGGASYALIDALDLKRAGGEVGLDYRGGAIGHILGGPVRPVAGIFFEGAAATSWRIGTSAKIGLTLAGSETGREMGIGLIAHDGLSTQRQFFRNGSRYWGLELRFDL